MRMHFVRIHIETTGTQLPIKSETIVNMHHVYEMRPNSQGGTNIYFIAPAEDGNEAVRVLETIEEILAMC
jgi:Na+-transporting NADH:ubiquinone oxidoreductase subunit NqrA